MIYDRSEGFPADHDFQQWMIVHLEKHPMIARVFLSKGWKTCHLTSLRRKPVPKCTAVRGRAAGAHQGTRGQCE